MSNINGSFGRSNSVSSSGSSSSSTTAPAFANMPWADLGLLKPPSLPSPPPSVPSVPPVAPSQPVVIFDHTLDNFEKLGKLGNGTYGDVYKVKHSPTGQLFAVKYIRDEASDNGVPATALRETSVLIMLDHPCVVKLHDFVCMEKSIQLVFEFMNEDLRNFIKTSSPMDNSIDKNLVKSFMYQLLQAMTYCHSRRVIHRDIKPQNVLVNADGRVKICDFGLARAFSVPIKPYTHEIVTLWYRAPEVLLGSPQYGMPVDIWSVALILPELLSRSALLHGDSEIDQIFQTFRVFGTPTPKEWPAIVRLPNFKAHFPKFKKDASLLLNSCRGDTQALDLLSAMLVYEPKQRLSARAALTHPFFDDFDKNSLPRARPLPADLVDSISMVNCSLDDPKPRLSDMNNNPSPKKNNK